MEIYLAILEDRHAEVQIEPFQKIIKALKKVTEWQLNYENEEWEEIDIDIDGWEYYIKSTCDDGPNIRIEKKILK